MIDKTDKTDMKAVLNELKDGRMIIVTDDEDRENEGDLLMAASCVRARDVNFMAKYGRGLICQSITAERARTLGLHAMAPDNNAALSTAFTVSVDARGTTSTGISAADRAATVRTIIHPNTKPDDLLRPGHIFPLIAHEKGVLGRRGHTEAGVDLARMAGLQPSALICEIMDDDGTMARGDRLKELAAKWGVAMVTIQDIIDFRLRNELKRVAETRLPTDYGDFHLIAYEPEAFALIKKTPASAPSAPQNPAGAADSSPKGAAKGSRGVAGAPGAHPRPRPLVRIHSECLTGESWGSRRCDCGFQLHHAMSLMEEEGAGVIVYLRQEGRGIGLVNKIRAYVLQDEGMDTEEANRHLHLPIDDRDYRLAAAILSDLDIGSCRLLTNNPEKINALEGFDMQRVSLEAEQNADNRYYLKTKKEKFGHLLSLRK